MLESSETINITLTSVDPAAILNPESAVITIQDNDGKYHAQSVMLKLYITVMYGSSHSVGTSWLVSKPFPPELGVTIGFSTTSYTVSEDEGSVSVAVFLRNGILARDVVVTLQTLDGAAMSEFFCNSFKDPL